MHTCKYSLKSIERNWKKQFKYYVEVRKFVCDICNKEHKEIVYIYDIC